VLKDVALEGHGYSTASVVLRRDIPAPIRCYVLTSLSSSQAFLSRVNNVILIISIAAIALCALLIMIVSRAITRPLENVVAGVKALAAGDYNYSIDAQGSREVRQLGTAFSSMRERLLESQKLQLAAERVAALGRTASSISHDLRHYLSALVANAEFLYEAEALKLDRDDVYREIKTASEQMLDLIDSMRDLAREQPSLSPAPGNLGEAIRQAVETVQARHDCRDCSFEVATQGDLSGVFDARKLARAMFNIVLNAYESTVGKPGQVKVSAAGNDGEFQVRVADNGHGIPSEIRDNLFDPFVSSGKQNGTGLGLAIASKIVQDHGGKIFVEETSASGTVILMKLPRTRAAMPPPLRDSAAARSSR
jgi:signal transduction histidine kinase